MQYSPLMPMLQKTDKGPKVVFVDFQNNKVYEAVVASQLVPQLITWREADEVTTQPVFDDIDQTQKSISVEQPVELIRDVINTHAHLEGKTPPSLMPGD